jgi:RNA polymerase sigma-70 factor (ECF subfamily)
MTDARRPSGGTSLTLLERLRANEPDAWRTMVHLYTPLVYHWCDRAGLRGADADDVSQEVFRAAAAGLAGFRRDRAGDTFRGWLRGITRNRVLQHFRNAGHEPQAAGGTEVLLKLQEVADERSLAGNEEDAPAEVDGLYRRALELVRGEFEERTWRAFWLTAVEDRPAGEVALELGMSPGAVRVAKSRVLRRLREELGEIP